MNHIRLDQWSPHELLLDAVEPEATEAHVVIAGTCYEHPFKEDGSEVATARISRVKVEQGLEGPMIIAVTISGTEYVLLEPAPSYELVFPNARRRMISWWQRAHPEEKLHSQPSKTVEPEISGINFGPWSPSFKEAA